MPSVMAWTVMSSIGLIACSVWALLMISAQRSSLSADARRRFTITSGLYLLGWLALAFVLGSSGIFQPTPTRAFPALATGIAFPVFTGAWLLNRSSVLKTVLAATPLPWLTGIQFYRVVGGIFLVLYSLDRMPGEFAIPAGWGDIAVGLAAPVVGYLIYRNYRWSCFAAASWNVVGILDLAVAVGTGFLTSPGSFQALAIENPNMLITAFPLVIVPLVAVPMSILLHLAALRRLRLASGVSPHQAFNCEGQSMHRVSHTPAG
ncbi:MAG: hypothetical protein GDA67_09225 [Nitrospira sp. CR1.3]|nr:hypothetical protein [Nitrospira sp. CR1.3]